MKMVDVPKDFINLDVEKEMKKQLNNSEKIKMEKEFDVNKIRIVGALLIKNIYWEQKRSLMPYDSTTYILPFAGELAELLRIDLDGNIKVKDKRGSWRVMTNKLKQTKEEKKSE